MSHITSAQSANLNSQARKLTQNLSSTKVAANLRAEQIGQIAKWQQQSSLSKINEENIRDRGMVGYTDRALDGLTQLISTTQQLLNLANQANPNTSTAEVRNELNANFQQLVASIGDFIDQVSDSGGNDILNNDAAQAIRYANQDDGTAIEFTPAQINAAAIDAGTLAAPAHDAINAVDFQITDDGAIGNGGNAGTGRLGSLEKITMMLGTYTGMVGRVKMIEGFMQANMENASSIVGDMQDKIDAELNPDMTEASQRLSIIGSLKQLLNSTAILLGKDNANKAAALSQVIASS